MSSLCNWLPKLGLMGALAIVSSFDCAVAQITPDDTLPNNSNVRLEGNTRIIEGGTTSGANLFHSFREFSVPIDSTAYFNNATEIKNIISRVTGQSISNIDGLIKANNANLFLINPNGIVFGPNARLDIGGSFLGSTASSLKFTDGFEFSATNLTTPLLTISVPIGLQYQSKAGNIEVKGSTLIVAPGKTLALMGGNVQITDGSRLLTGGGRVELGGFAGVGTIGLNVDGTNLRLIPSDSVARTDVSLRSAEVNVIAGGEGSIAINARNLDIMSGSTISSGRSLGFGTPDSVPANITLNTTDTIQVAGGSISNSVNPGAEGKGGNIDITTKSLLLTNGAQVSASTLGRGDAGNVTIKADTASFNGVSSDGRSSGVFSNVEQGATGNGGNVTIETKSLTVTNGAQVGASSLGWGNAGNVSIRGTDTVSFNGVGSDGRSSGAFSNIEQGAVGKGGAVDITTKLLSLTQGAQVGVYARGRGEAGNVTIAADTVSFDGQSNRVLSGIFSTVVEQGAVNTGGKITIATKSLAVTNGAQINTSTLKQGDAGNVTIRATDSVSLDGVVGDGRSSGAFSIVGEEAVGKGGSVDITTRLLTATKGAQVGALSFGKGDAGDVIIRATDSVSFDGVASDGQRSGGAFSTVERQGTGKAGSVDITTRSLTVTNGSQVSVYTRGSGNAGNVAIKADNISFRGQTNEVFSGVFSTTEQEAIGTGGNIDIKTNSLRLSDGAQISAFSLGTGDAGNIKIQAFETVSFDGVVNGERSSGAFSTIERQGVGKGGNVDITAKSFLLTDGARVGVFTLGQGNAGNVTLTADTVSLDGQKNEVPSGVFSTAEPGAVGNGGSINIQARSILLSNGAQVSVNGQGTGVAGNIEATARFIQLDSEGKFIAETKSGNGGNITLQPQDNLLLVLRRQSLISTNAGTASAGGDGGNITINAPSGFLIAVKNENSDITANAFTGRGGNVNIRLQNIFGIQRQERQTLQSDITASSQLGISGIVEIATPDVDPSNGLVELPTNLVDASQQISKACTPGTRQFENTFVVTGRGGLPMSPTEPLQDSTTLAQWVRMRAPFTTQVTEVELGALDVERSRASAQERRSQPENSAVSITNKVTTAPTQIVEASGWVVDSNRNIELVAQTNQSNLHSFWNPASCPVSQ